MKLKARLWIALFIIGILSCVVLPSVNAETFDIGTKESKSDLFQDWHYYSSGTILNIDSVSDEELYNNISYIFDGDISTGIDEDTDDSQQFITLYFPDQLFVNNITILPNFGGETTDYYIKVIFGINEENFLPYGSNITQFFYVNASIDGIKITLDGGSGNNHIYFNDVIINYTPTLPNIEELQNQIDNLNNTILQLESENVELKTEIGNLTSEMEDLRLEIENLTEDGEQDDDRDEDDSEFDDLFLEPPFIGLLWLILIIVLILNLIGRRANKKGKPEVSPESTEEESPSPEPEESQPSEKEEEVGGRFCPNCGKFTDEKVSFCPYCKRSME